MPYVLPPPPGFGYTDSVEARRMAMLKHTAREADAWIAARQAQQEPAWAYQYQAGAGTGQNLNAVQAHVQRNGADVSGNDVAEVEETGLTQPFSPCTCHPISSIAFPCPNLTSIEYSLFGNMSIWTLTQAEISENERIARMALNRIWEQPTPIGNGRPAPFQYGHITPPPPPPISQNIPVMRASYLPDSPYYIGEPEYVAPGWPANAIRAEPIGFNPFDYDDAAFRAPALNPRTIHPAYNSYVPTAVPFQEFRQLSLNEALATWYAEQVVTVLVKPGMFRPGENGACEDTWGTVGREREGWARIGQPVPAIPPHRRMSGRDPTCETYDPWGVMWKNEAGLSSRLVVFIYDLIQRMTIGPTSVVSAVWYLHGLGLHEGDGTKGMAIRGLLRKMYSTDDEAVERRVALLGLLLAGKWLDDNSFLTKSWCVPTITPDKIHADSHRTEVSGLPVKDIDLLERAALADLYYSLHIPLSGWADHVNKRWTELLTAPERSDDAYDVVLEVLDGMVTDARATELYEPPSPHPSQFDYYAMIDQRLEELYYAEELERLPPSLDSTPVSQYLSPRGIDSDMTAAAQNVDALVDDAMGCESEDEESEDEFLDYDGAARFLPTISELRRSASNSSAEAEAIANLEKWRNSVREAELAQVRAQEEDDHSFVFYPPTAYASPLLPSFPMIAPPAPTRSRDHNRITSSEARQEPHDPARPAATVRKYGPQSAPAPVKLYRSDFKETGVVLEPGISQVRPPTGGAATGPSRQPLNSLPILQNRNPSQEVMGDLNYKGWASNSRW